MPNPRNISTDKRASMLDDIDSVFEKQAAKLDDIIVDLSKKHVDDPVVAKELLKRAKSLRKALPVVA